MRRTVLLAAAILLLSTVAAPATAVTDEELYDLRVELQEALGELADRGILPPSETPSEETIPPKGT